MLYAAWDHNPQEEFHTDVEIHWKAWLPIGIAMFLGTGGIIPLIQLLYFLFKRK